MSRNVTSVLINSCLSEEVKLCISHCLMNTETIDVQIRNLIVWDELRKKLFPDGMAEIMVPEEELSGFLPKLAIFINSVSKLFESLTLAEYENHIKEQLQWTSQEKNFRFCFEELKKADRGSTIVAIQILISTIERVLGNVYLLRGKHVPFLIRDLLKSSELISTMGYLPVFILRVIMGSPSSLNLRNILWHGFVAPDEIDERLGYFLVAIFASLNECMSSVTPLPIRDFVRYNNDEYWISGPLDLNCIKKLFNQSPLVLNSMQYYWEMACQAFLSQRYVHCIVLVLQQLENMLRCLFTLVHHCPQRVMTAQASEFYLTFNEMLSEYYDESKINKLPNVTGNTTMILLLDLLIYRGGPRLRDRVSHGEMELDALNESIASHVLHVAASICASYERSEYGTQLLQDMEQRRGFFHPIDMARRKLDILLSSLMTWLLPGEPQFQDGETEKCISEIFTIIFSEQLKFVYRRPENMFDNMQHLKFALVHMLHSTVYRHKIEKQLAKLLTQIISQAQNSMQHLQEGLNLQRTGIMRSRQRKNYQFGLLRATEMHQGLALLATVSFLILHNINHASQQEENAILKFLWRLVYYTENISTELQNHRWTETLTLIKQLCTYIKNSENILSSFNRVPSQAVTLQ